MKKENDNLLLQELKAKHGTVYTVTAPLDEDETQHATIYLRRPDRNTYSVVSKLAGGNDPLRAIEAGLKALYIGGDELKTVIENDTALMSCESVIVELLRKKEAILKKN